MTTEIGGKLRYTPEVGGNPARWQFQMDGPFMVRDGDLRFTKIRGCNGLGHHHGYQKLTQVGKKLARRLLTLPRVQSIKLTALVLEVEASSVFEWVTLQDEVLTILRHMYAVDGVEMIVV